jgi:membrane protein DedA with SNARE-associated domain
VAIGFLTGLGLLVGGVVMSRKNFAALSQTLCATGVVILYAVTFACRSIYHFDFFGMPIPTFLLMVLITATAFLLAVRLNALVVAILGMLGGFLTPVCFPPAGQSARPLRLHRHPRRRADFRRAEQTLAFSHRARRARHGHHANRLGGQFFESRKIF